MSSGSHPNHPSLPTGGATTVVDRMNLSLQFRRYFKLVAQRWPLLVLCTLIGTGYYSYKAFTTPDTFEAYSIITHAAKVRVPSAKPELLEELSQYYQNNIHDLLSSSVTTPVYQHLHEKMPLVANTITRLDAGQGPGSSFKLTVDATTPAAAKEFARLWADEFKNFKDRKRTKIFGKNLEDIQEEILKLRDKQRTSQLALNVWLTNNNITSIAEMLTGAQRRWDALLEQQKDAETKRKMLEFSTKETIANSGSLNLPSPKSPSPSANPNQPLTDTSDPLEKFEKFSGSYRELKLQLTTVEDEIERYKGVLKDLHPVMQELRAKAEDLKRRLQFNLDVIEEERLARIESYKKQEQSLAPLIQRAEVEAKQFAALSREYQQLQDNERRTKQNLEALQQAASSFDLAAMDNEQYEVADAGIGSDAPIGPNRPKMILTGLALGFAIGLALVYFLHRLDDRLELAQEIEEALEEPVLGQIPLVDKKTDYLLISHLDQHDFFAESIRGIRSAILFGGKEHGKTQVLLISSAVPGDGKTTFTVNFAITLALAGHRVLLVDADLRRGNVHNFFHMDREPGASEILSGEIHWLDVLRPCDIPGLSIITSGKITANPGELLMSPISQQLIADVREQYDYIIFDCPPLTGIDDTFSLLANGDGLLFVVRAGQTSMRFAKTALASVRHRGARILGLVLNGITSDNPYYYYYSYYHAYYSKEPAVTGTPQAPGVKMPAPKKNLASIEAEAKARAVQKSSSPTEPVDSVSKTEFFKARRAAHKSNPPSADPETKTWEKSEPTSVPPTPPPDSPVT